MQGAAGSLAGDVFADWGTVQSTSDPGGYGLAEVNSPLCHVPLCALPSQARHTGTNGSLGSERGQPPSPVPEEEGTGTSLLCRLP